jgi:chloride channel 3/4/5
MSHDEETANCNEQTHLLDPRIAELSGHRRRSQRGNGARADDSSSIISSHLSKEEEALGGTAIGERLPYNDYTTIDWLHDLVRAPIR